MQEIDYIDILQMEDTFKKSVYILFKKTKKLSKVIVKKQIEYCQKQSVSR